MWVGGGVSGAALGTPRLVAGGGGARTGSAPQPPALRQDRELPAWLGGGQARCQLLPGQGITLSPQPSGHWPLRAQQRGAQPQPSAPTLPPKTPALRVGGSRPHTLPCPSPVLSPTPDWCDWWWPWGSQLLPCATLCHAEPTPC